MLVGNRAVSQVASKAGQVQNNRLLLENTLIWNKITQKVSSLDQFGLGRIIENEMQFGEKIYENNKK